MELAQGEIGAEGSYDLALVGGKLVLSVKHASKGAELGVSVAVDGDYFADKLAAAIPGKLDDAIIGMLKAALKA